jgi:hypothetical protein
MKIVVFDLDETLGYFQEYGIFWNSLNEYLLTNKKCINENVFNQILDIEAIELHKIKRILENSFQIKSKRS